MKVQKNDFSHLTASDNAFIDALFADYKNNPDSVDDSWKQFFRGFEYRLGDADQGAVTDAQLEKEFNVYRLIQSFRARGHLLSDTNPIKARKDRAARLDIASYNLTNEDLEQSFHVGQFVGLGVAKLSDIIKKLKRIYCYHIGLEYMHSNNTDIRRWIRDKFESEYHNIDLPLEKKKRILFKLNQAQVFESFLQTKYIGQKRFSLEGGESTIPALDALINKGVDLGVKEFVVGMAHRGRLNVLANTIGKSYEFIFKEFEGDPDERTQHTGGGDVKYHQGYSSIQKTHNGKDVYLKLMHNPSHLECVAPVALGYARAQSDIRYDHNTSEVCPIMIHGDAAVAGQGIVYETLQMAELPAYRCGGAIHFVINNQVGFTTDWSDARSSHYCTSIARTLEAPVIHVNGDDPESVVYAMELAIEFRQKFKTDIFVDMVCYRKHGHNEGDEPKFTQPHLYGLIAKQKNPRELYIDALIASGDINKELALQTQNEFKQMLSDRFNNVKDKNLPERVKGPHTEWLDLRWSTPQDFDESPQTGVKRKVLDEIFEKLTSYPDGFNVLKKANKILEDRKSAYKNDKLDWAICELLAYGTLLTEGNNVRFSGQDVVRGTFSHRHAKLFDEKTNEAYCGLSHLQKNQGEMKIYNSHLSEYAVLGFEYGYSQASPKSLNIWEAQFGDFSNTAQVIVDQFICSGEVKWERMTGLVMLLPHGYEGQGPEHSSARPERFLQLTAQDNMVILNVSSPANMFHALRRQQAWDFRKPMVCFTPKSLLRDPRCISKVDQLTSGTFYEIIDDAQADKKKIKRVIVCTGKVAYDLISARDEQKRDDVAIVRLEQLYPFPHAVWKMLEKKYSGADFIWAQEEPENMGYWPYLISRELEIFKNFRVVARKISATPATGFAFVHQLEQKMIIEECFK
jgi:2-oxoglutarate dehydrogenase E1 component